MAGVIERGIDAIASDRVHGAGYLARKALGILALAAPERRAEIGCRLSALRPELPAIANAVAEAIQPASADAARGAVRGLGLGW